MWAFLKLREELQEQVVSSREGKRISIIQTKEEVVMEKKGTDLYLALMSFKPFETAEDWREKRKRETGWK